MTLELEKMCRLCLDTTDPKYVLDEIKDSEIILIIETNTKLKIFKEVHHHFVLMPQICAICYERAKAFVIFCETCLRSDHKIQSLLLELEMNDTKDEDMQSREATQEVILNYPPEELAFKTIVEDAPDETDTEYNELAIEIVVTDNTDTPSSQKLKKGKKSYSIPCEICGKLYTKGDMKYHLNLHNGIRPYSCGIDDCSKAFSSPLLLSRHKKVIHSDVKRYECEICGKLFKHSSVLKFHRSYHGDPQIPCDVCGKMMRNERALKKHMMVHTGERPHQCKICEKSFQTAYTLRIHQRGVHGREKPYVCRFCGQAYSYNCLLKVHLEKIHQDVEKS